MLRSSAIVLGLFLMIILPSIHYQTYASEVKTIKGELTASCGIMPFGGEEVGSFELEAGSQDRIQSLKISMNDSPGENKYIVGFMGLGSRPGKLPDALVKVDEYRSDGRVMITEDKMMPSDSEILFVAERDPDSISTGWSLINITGTAYLTPPLKSFPESDRFEYDNATIIHVLDLDKKEYELGEKIEIKPKLLNIGNENVTILHGSGPFRVGVYTPSGALMWFHPLVITSEGPISVMLEPGVPYRWQEDTVQRLYDLRLCMPGEYVIVSYAAFSIAGLSVGEYKEGQSISRNVRVYAEPIMIKVNPPLVDGNVNFECPPDNIEFVKKLYEDKIRRINNAVNSFKVSEPDASIAEQNEYLLRQGNVHLNLAGINAECLSNNGIDPDSVTMLSSQAQQVLMYDYERLSEIAPELVKYSTVPEFPVNLMIITAVGVMGTIIALRCGWIRYNEA